MRSSNSAVTQSKRYEKCLVWTTEEDARKIKELALNRDGVNLTVEGNVMYFADKSSTRLSDDIMPRKRQPQHYQCLLR